MTKKTELVFHQHYISRDQARLDISNILSSFTTAYVVIQLWITTVLLTMNLCLWALNLISTKLVPPHNNLGSKQLQIWNEMV